MNVIISAFWGEGPSDERFLPKIIYRALEDILFKCAQGEWDVFEPVILTTNELHFPEQVADIAKKAKGFTLVFIHTDADARNISEKAFPYKINPALELLSQLSEEEACKHIIPVIPVTKMESWKLADFDALQDLLGVQLDAKALGMGKKAMYLEQSANVKILFDNVLKAVGESRGRRRSNPNASDVDEALAKMVSMDRLKQLNSFRQFLDALKTTLAQMNIIKKDCDP